MRMLVNNLQALSRRYVTVIKKIHKIVQLMFFQIRTICTKLCGSPQRRSSFRRIAKRVCGRKKAPEELDPLQKHLDIGMLMVLRDVITRWNSTHAMIRRSLILQDVSCWQLTCIM